jgi:hypothetical protein
MIFTNNNAVKSRDFDIVMNFNNDDENVQQLIFPIKRVSSKSNVPAIRFLGVYFDENLNFKFHINLISSKLSKALFILRSVKQFVTPNALKSLYYSLFHCNLIYCIHIWSSTSSANLKQISVLQKKAIRIIANKSYNAHTEPIFKSLEILPFPNLVSFFNLQFMQHYFQGFLPSAFNNVWLTNVTRHREDLLLALRNSENVNIPFARLHSSTIQPLVNLPRLWSQFEEENIKILRNKLEFNHKLKLYFLKKLSSTIHCTRLLCPTCHF